MRLRCRSAIAVVGLALTASAFAPQASETSEKAIVAAAAAYVATYQQQLTSILADETYTQQIVDQVPYDPLKRHKRQTKSEVFFMFGPVRRDWMTIRDVTAVDGTAIQDRRDFREALQTLPAEQVVEIFREQNSRFNIGETFRNFNEPTFSLLVLDEQAHGRFSFDRRRVERVDDATLVTLEFSEREGPTLIRNPDRKMVFVKGEMVVEAGSGRVRRARLTGQMNDVHFDLTTVYSPNSHLGIWVPLRFAEEYVRGKASPAQSIAARVPYERVICEAAYSNFRRFDTSVRIK
jgi:hypothetical protein